MEIIIKGEETKINFQLHEATQPKALLILAHGAGAGMNHPFMQSIASLLIAKKISVILFNFPYMEAGRKSPGSPKKNVKAWRAVLDCCTAEFPNTPIFLGGKSYGGRMGSHLLAEESDHQVQGIVYFGFPLHAPGKESKDRAGHLSSLQTPQLFLQGTKDKLANQTLISEVVYEIGDATLTLIEHADHSFHIPKKSGRTDDEVLAEICKTAASWIDTLLLTSH